MSQVNTNGRANNVELAVENGQASAPALVFQAQVGPQRQADVVALRPLQAKLPTLNTRELLDRPMIHFHPPSAVSQEVALRFGHTQAIGSPGVRLAVWVNRPKYLDHAIAAQVYLHTAFRNIQIAHRLLLACFQTHLSIALEPRQPFPAEVAHQLQVLQAAVPTVERELDPYTVAAVEGYLITRNRLAEDSPLFVATEEGQRTSVHTGHGAAERPLTARTVHRLVRKYADRALGKGHGIHPHSLRHTAAMEAARHGTVSEVSKLLRHKNTRITTIYLDHVDDSATYHLTETLGKVFAE